MAKKSRAISLLFLAFLTSCFSAKNRPPLTANELLYRKGKASFMANCTVCHNMNPKLAGSIGPELYASSEALLRARIMSATYPAGYKPKRNTTMMVELPELEADIPALFYFLNH